MKWPWVSRKRIAKLELNYAKLLTLYDAVCDKRLESEREFKAYKRSVHNFSVQCTANLYQAPDVMLRGRVLQAMQSLDNL